MAISRALSIAVFAFMAATAAFGANLNVASEHSTQKILIPAPPPVFADVNSLSSTYTDLRSINNTAFVEVYAGNFVGMLTDPLTKHPVKVYIDTFDDAKAVLMATDATGFMQMQINVGSRVFLTLLGGNGFHETTTAISTVPPEGLNGLFGRIVLQVPTDLVYSLFTFLIGRPTPPNTCQVVVTITQYNTTYNTAPQGWEGVEATVVPADVAVGDARPYYFGMTPSHGTDPMPNNRTTTSPDGGVVFPAIPVNTGADVIISGRYKDYSFTTSAIRCMRGGQFINAAPNQGPKATRRIVDMS